MTEADELKANVAGIAQETNGLLTRATALKVDSEAMAVRIQQLATHNLDIAHASSLLSHSMENDFRVLFNKYILAVRILEDFVGKV